MNPQSIAALKLRVLRSDAGLTQAEMGTRLGISGPLISMVERGKRVKSAIRIAQRAATILGKDFKKIDYKEAKLNRLERHRPAKYLEALAKNCPNPEHRVVVEGLRKLRSERKLTQGELGVILRVTESAICCTEYGKCSYVTTLGMLRRAQTYFVNQDRAKGIGVPAVSAPRIDVLRPVELPPLRLVQPRNNIISISRGIRERILLQK